MPDADDLLGGDGPLRWLRLPLEWNAYDEEGTSLRLCFIQSGTAAGPGAAISEGMVSEGVDVVAITLFERVMAGVYPDGSIAVSALAAVPGCLEPPGT